MLFFPGHLNERIKQNDNLCEDEDEDEGDGGGGIATNFVVVEEEAVLVDVDVDVGVAYFADLSEKQKPQTSSISLPKNPKNRFS